MEINVEQSTLVRELSLLQGIIERKATIPILSNVLLSAQQDGRLVLTATDLEVGYRSSVEAEVSRPGTTAVDARRLHDIVRRLPSGTISFKLDGNALHISCERIRYRLNAQDTEQFPSLPVKEGNATGTIKSSQLADMVRRVLFAITADDPRYSLGGALWRLEDARLLMVATDGHRLSLAGRPARKLDPELGDIVVPRKALSEIQKLADDDDADTYFWVRQATLHVQVGERELNTHLQEQKFPDYTRVIPQNNDKHIDLGTSDLRRAIERVAVLSPDQSRMVKLSLVSGGVTLSSEHSAFGDAKEELEIDYAGEGLDIGFNAQYLVDFLSVAGTEKVRLSLGEAMGQGLFQPLRADDDEREDSYVVMPMALG